MKRKFFSIISLILILASLLGLPVSAASPEEGATVTPRYVNIALMNASGSINSNDRAYCYSYVETANSTYTVYLTMSLQRYKDGEWSNIKTWTSSGTQVAEMGKYHYVASGYYYRTGVTATVYTSGGSYVESATTYSQSYYG